MADTNIKELTYSVPIAKGVLGSTVSATYVTEVNKKTGASVTYSVNNATKTREAILRSDPVTIKNPDGTIKNTYQTTIVSSYQSNFKALNPNQQKFVQETLANEADKQRAKFINPSYTQEQKDNLFPGMPGVKNVSPSNPNAGPGGTPTTISKEELEKSIKSKARTKYDQLIKYPLTLNENFQDYIKFQMVVYKPRGIGLESINSLGVIPARERINTSTKRNTGEANTKREILGSVVLPIPGNISDGNTVSWGDARTTGLETELTKLAVSGIMEGPAGLESSIKKSLEAAGKNTSSIKSLLVGKFTELATGINPLTRLYGVVANPNLELLFSGPDLRNFTFTFRLSPRDKDEAIVVRKIIRFFKQGMSVKRTDGELFLGSPHTFQLSYWNTTTREHPYLNKFKECALKSFSVNYAPDGTYMTYNDRNEPSMTAYEITMQFTELEPVFDDDYGNNENKPAKDFIGY